MPVMNIKTIVSTMGAALALSGCVCCSDCSNPLIGSWEGDLPEQSMPATSLIFSRGDGGEMKAYVLYRWGSPEWCSDVEVDGSTFSFRHPYGQLYRGSVRGDVMTAEIAPCDRKTGAKTGDWKVFTAKRVPEIAPAKTSDAKLGLPIDLLKDGLAGWESMNPKAKFGWKFKDRILSNQLGLKPDGKWAGGGANLKKKRADFYDFNLKYEVRVLPGCNSGVYLRGIYEIQVLDSFGKPVDMHHMAAYYGRVTPKVAAEKPANQWQTVDVTLYKRHLTVILNGVKIIDQAPVVGITGGAMTADEFVPGPLYIQGDHSDADFRNMVLTPMK